MLIRLANRGIPLCGLLYLFMHDSSCVYAINVITQLLHAVMFTLCRYAKYIITRVFLIFVRYTRS